MLRGMWDLPRPGLEPMSPALAGGFLTTAPPGKSLIILFIEKKSIKNLIINQNFLELIKICEIYFKIVFKLDPVSLNGHRASE